MTCGETPLDQPPDPSQPAEPDDLGEDFDTLFATDLMEMMFETMRLQGETRTPRARIPAARPPSPRLPHFRRTARWT